MVRLTYVYGVAIKFQ